MHPPLSDNDIRSDPEEAHLRSSLWRRMGLVLPAGVGSCALILALALNGMAVPASQAWIAPLLLIALAGLLLSALRLHQRLLQPLSQLEESVGQVCQGEPGARLAVPQANAIHGLVGDIESLNEELVDLYEDMDNRVARQTRRLAQKTASLKILYEVAASINQADDVTRLLLRYLRILKEMVNGRAATVRLRAADGGLRLVGSVGEDGEVMQEHEMFPLPLCRCGRVLVPGEILCRRDARLCSKRNGRRMYGLEEVATVDVPLLYHDESLGLFRIYVDRPGIQGREDILELLTTIGNHLGIAIAKQRSDAEARRLSIIEERNHLAHELHDSLAQTLVSLRYQVRMLQETLEQRGGTAEAKAESVRIRAGLDEAHTELRELLNSFRAPLDQRGLLPALEKLVEEFRQATGLSIFFQQDCRQLRLSAQEEMQILRIVQESLANIRKHAQAHTVRILLRCRSEGSYMLLVEDDGVGFDQPPFDGRPGENIGLSILQERARRIGARLRIESEPGEGTRVEMIFKPGGKTETAAAREVC